MLWISLFIVAFGETFGPDKPYYQIVNATQDCSILFQMGEKAKVTLFRLDSDGQISNQTYATQLDPKSLFQIRATPIGDNMMPAFSLLGLKNPDTIALFRTRDRQIVEILLDDGAVLGEKPLSFPTNPKSLFFEDGQSILISSLITQDYCNGIGDCEYFHIVTQSDWRNSSFFGRAKSFRNSFMVGDIPCAFWWPAKNVGGIFYSKSKELFLYSKKGDEQIIETRSEKTLPAGRIELVALGDSLILMIGEEKSVSAYKLEGSIWKAIGEWKGSWVAFSALGKEALLVDGKGKWTQQPLFN